VALRPAVRALTAWGDEFCAPSGPRRVLRHAVDEAPVAAAGYCTRCGAAVGAADTVVAPGAGLLGAAAQDPVTAALATPHRLLAPLRG
jgi:hypothetical protein